MCVEQTGARESKAAQVYLSFFLELFSLFILEADIFLSLTSLYYQNIFDNKF